MAYPDLPPSPPAEAQLLPSPQANAGDSLGLPEGTRRWPSSPQPVLQSLADVSYLAQDLISPSPGSAVLSQPSGSIEMLSGEGAVVSRVEGDRANASSNPVPPAAGEGVSQVNEVEGTRLLVDIESSRDERPGEATESVSAPGDTPADASVDSESPAQSPADLDESPRPTTRPPLGAATQLDIIADYQSYDPVRQVVTASGDVQLTLSGSLLQAQKVWINLLNRYVLAEGDVLLTRGAQLVRGQRVEYSLAQGAGTVFDAKGQLSLTALGDDFADPTVSPTLSRRAFDPLNPDRGVSSVVGVGGLQFGSNTDINFPGAEGGVRQLRFEAGQLDFDALAWRAEDVRITNDPFSPPELELRSDRLTITSLNDEQDLLRVENPRLVFDQGFTLPLFRQDYILNRGQFDADDLNPLPTGIGVDGRDRGGLFIERGFTVYETPDVTVGVTPRYLVSNALDQGLFDANAFGIGVDVSARVANDIAVTASADLSGLVFNEISENLRANVRAQRLIGDHTLALEYSYRDRLYNGSLGFQDVRSSLGAVLLSPVIVLNDAGLSFDYQIGAQYITAETDRVGLLGLNPTDNLVSLGRFQGSARLFQGFTLWQGTPLPATPTEGLRYTPSPVTPSISLGASLRGVATYYTNGDFQELLAGAVSLNFQFGHLSAPMWDYTRFNVGYYQAFVGGDDSPFLFDRDVDRRVLSLGLMQQVHGPLLLGFQSSLNLDSGDDVSTDIILEYSRRTYGILLRYSPTRSTGAIGFRLSDFSWVGGSDPFDELGRDVEGGVIQQ
ncbi:MAG: DUF3769 domain-containing protein [Cyanobacteria bacterium J06632_22]